MARKRMFDREIINTDKFCDMPMSTKGLYFLLGMEADDHGFVSPRRVMRVHGASEDDLNMLIYKGYVIKFETGVIVIREWKKNNYINISKQQPTEYIDELSQLTTIDSVYELKIGSELAESLPEVSSNLAQNRIEENSIDKNRIEENSIEEYKEDDADKSADTPSEPAKKVKPKKTVYAEFVSMTIDEYSSLVTKLGEDGTKRCIEILDNYKGSTGKKYKSDYRTILNWVITRYEEENRNANNSGNSTKSKPRGVRL